MYHPALKIETDNLFGLSLFIFNIICLKLNVADLFRNKRLQISKLIKCFKGLFLHCAKWFGISQDYLYIIFFSFSDISWKLIENGKLNPY